MIRTHETARTISFFRPVPLTDLPLIYQREHLFPYTSYDDTASTPVPRAFRLVVLENDARHVEVAPELGGRVFSLFDKRIGKEIAFQQSGRETRSHPANLGVHLRWHRIQLPHRPLAYVNRGSRLHNGANRRLRLHPCWRTLNRHPARLPGWDIPHD